MNLVQDLCASINDLILFVNVLVTDTRASAGGMNRADRLDTFRYTLASYACIDRISRVIIYCELAPTYKAREGELRDYVASLFPRLTVEYHDSSPHTQSQWKAVLEASGLLATTAPIIYVGNDDHVFIDYDLDVLYEGLSLMAQEPPDQINTIHISSWTEAISTVYGLNEYTTVGRYWKANLLYPDAIQVVNSTFFRHLLVDSDIGDAYMRRTDELLTNWYPSLGDYRYAARTAHPKVVTFIPLRELVRHFDGYWHIGVPFEYCPMLSIPEGFFSDDIQLSDGTLGVPLFWRERILATHIAYPPMDDRSLAARYNLAHRRAMIAPHNRGYQRPGVRHGAAPAPRYRSFGDFTELPLPDDVIQIGALR